MKAQFSIWVIFWTIGLSAQSFHSLGTDNSPYLNETEVTILNRLLEEQRNTFNFRGKKVAFITGSSGNRIVAKQEYFQNSIIPWMEKNSTPQIFMVKLTEEQKLKSGGYDVLVLSWVKIFTARREKKIIEKLANLK